MQNFENILRLIKNWTLKRVKGFDMRAGKFTIYHLLWYAMSKRLIIKLRKKRINASGVVSYYKYELWPHIELPD